MARIQARSPISLQFAQASDSPESEPPPTLQLGSTAAEVKSLQQTLTQLGYYDGKISGTYDAATQQATQQFQQANDLQADGVVGPTTWEKLQQARAAAPTPEASPSPDAESESESESESDSSNNRRQLLFWIIGAMALVGVVSLLFYWLLRLSSGTENAPLEPEAPDRASEPSQEEDEGDGTAQTASQTSKNGYFDGNSEPPEGERDGDETGTDETDGDSLSIEKTTRLPKIDIVDELVKELEVRDPVKRRKAIWELGQRGDSRAIQPLVNLMVESDSHQRSLILAALSEIGSRSLKPMNRALAMSLQDENPEVRKNAIRDVTRIYEIISNLSQLLQYASDDTDGEVRETADWALQQLNRIRSLPPREDVPTLGNSGDSDERSGQD
jgi:peptidoglycan hydrolase-like protein with peptidoglycan-binding domain